MATNKFSWTISATKLLIAEYEANEMLYNAKHSDYKNRNKRLALYESIAASISEVIVGCTASDVRKKINGLRCQYLAEKMKIQKSMKSGADANSVYTPTAYWFTMLHFLDAGITSDESQSNLEIPHKEHSQEQYEENIGEESFLPDHDGQLNPVEPTLQTKTPKRKKHDNYYDSLLVEASSTMKEMSKIASQCSGKPERDSIDTFGTFVSNELRGIRDASNDYIFRMAKRKIQNVLMKMWDAIDASSPLNVITVPNSDPSSNSSQWTFTTDSTTEEDSISSITTSQIISNALQTANIINKGSEEQ